MVAVTKSEKILFSEEDLFAELHRFIQTGVFDGLVIMCGHFMLFYDQRRGELTPGIYEDIEDAALSSKVKERVGIFPSYTWDIGIRLGEQFTLTCQKPAKLLLLVNDWQYVPDQGEAGDHRSKYYQSLTALPPTFAKRLAASDVLSVSDVMQSRRHPLAFPETWLRYRFQNAAKRLVKQGKLQKRYLLDKPGQSEVSYTSESGTSLPLISCGITGCAGEITEMISEVRLAGGRHLVIFAPAECHAPIQAGVEIALSVYDLRGMNVMVAETGGSGEMTTDEIFGAGASLATFAS